MMKEKQAQCKMDVCYINIRKIFTEYTHSICTSFLEIAFWWTADCIMVANSVFSASVIYIFNTPITGAWSSFYIYTFYNILYKDI